jgi:RNA polymerase sigma-70 factor, ECF subfamily
VSAHAADPDVALLARLRAGDEQAFRALVQRYHASMLRVARLHVRDAQAAEEVVQETWMAVVKGLERFEERSTLQTWLFRILSNRAKTRGVRESRSTPFSALVAAEASGDEPAVDPDRFQTKAERHPGHWAAPPASWETLPDERLLAKETLTFIAAAIEALTPVQRTVIRLRDVDGLDSTEVCDLLDLSQGNQRVLLHRARSKVRAALETHLAPELVA